MHEEKPMAAGKCCRCGCRIWLTPSHYYAAMEGRSKIAFHCGYGHAQHFCDEDDEIVKIRRERDRLKQAMAEKDDRIQHLNSLLTLSTAELTDANERLIKQRDEAKKVTRRVGNGTCPCCQRTFKQLAAHMRTKHPHYENGAQGVQQ